MDYKEAGPVITPSTDYFTQNALMKLQTYARPKGSTYPYPVLINLAVDTASFLPRGPICKQPFLVLNAAFVRGTALNKANTITLKDEEPVVTVNRIKPFPQNDEDILDLKTHPFKEEGYHGSCICVYRLKYRSADEFTDVPVLFRYYSKPIPDRF